MKLLLQAPPGRHASLGLTKALIRLGVNVDVLSRDTRLILELLEERTWRPSLIRLLMGPLGLRSSKMKGLRMLYMPILPGKRTSRLGFKLWLDVYVKRMLCKYDVIHTNSAGDDLPIRIINSNVNMVHTVRGSAFLLYNFIYGLEKAPPLYRKYYEDDLRCVEMLVEIGVPITTLSAFMRDLLRRYIGVDAEVIYNGCDLKRFNINVSGKAMRKRWKIPEDKKVVIWVGRTTSHKDPLTFLKAIPLVMKEHGDAIFILEGCGPLDITIRREINRLKLHKYVIFKNTWLPETIMPYLYAMSDVFVATYLYEAFGMTVVEAMACGKPVVATAFGALPELVGDCGLLFEPRNPADLAEKISALLDDDELRMKLGRKAFLRVKERFTWDKIAKDYLRVYRRAMRS